MNGIIVLDKPSGVTSRWCVDFVIRQFKTKKLKAGHAGTLDPFASGVLPICLGRATKLVEYLRKSGKTYEAALRLNIMTDTWDITGKVIEVKEQQPAFEVERIRSIFSSMIGCLLHRIPDYSACKIDGKRFYELARKGQPVPDRYKEVKIIEMSLIRYCHPVITFRVTCSEGTYIRSLSKMIAEKLGTIGILTSLRRTRVGSLKVINAIKPEHVELNPQDNTGNYILPMASAIQELPKVELTGRGEHYFRNGRMVSHSDFSTCCEIMEKDLDMAVFGENGVLIGIGLILKPDPTGNTNYSLKPYRLVDIQSS